MERLLYVVLVVAAAGVAGCEDEDSAVARLLEHDGAVDKDGDDSGWTPVEGKDRFACQHGVRTGGSAWARVELTGGSRIQLKEETLIRFACAGQKRGFDVEFGESEIEADEGGELLLDIGSVTMSRGGRYRVRASKDGSTRFEVIVGAAIVRRRGAPPEELGPREGLELQVGAATVRRLGPDDEHDAGPTAGMPEDAGAPEDAGLPEDAGATSAVTAPEVTATVRGAANKRRAPGASAWEALPQGEHMLAPGTGLRVARGGSIALDRGGERAELTGPARAVVGEPGGDLLEAQRGSALVHATGAPVRIRVPGGVIVARQAPGAGTRARIDVDKEQTRVRPESGRVDVIGAGGEAETVQLGERARLGRGGRVEAMDRAPEHADLIFTAGESATIHDPRPPTALGFRFGQVCAAAGHGREGVVEVARNSRFQGRVIMSKGTGRAHVRLVPRAYHYRVRCLVDGVPEGRARARGRVWVKRDAGTRPLAADAPQNLVDADGRRYTVLYQNRLPEIVFRWPRAQGAGPYKLHITPKGGSPEVHTTGQPRYRARAGTLGEGTYRFFFQRGDERSRTSTLRIDFDNAAPSAYLRLPRVGKPWPDAKVHVAGAALSGWSVSVAGRDVKLDRKGRFSIDVPRPSPERALAVRIAHPRRGVHYYLRRDGAEK